MNHSPFQPFPAVTRRTFLTDAGLGFGALALGALLHTDGVARADGTAERNWSPPSGLPHFAPKAKSVIWMFMVGGASHMESFDPKPELTRYADKSIAETPYKDSLDQPFLTENVRSPSPQHQVRQQIMPLQVGFRKRGQSGIEVSDWFTHTGGCVDDMAIVRSMWTTHNNHGAQLQFHTGRHPLDGFFPTIGSWVHYGLGSLNDNLPQFIVLGTPLADCCGGVGGHDANYLGPRHSGVQLSTDPKNPLPFVSPHGGQFQKEQQQMFELVGQLNRAAVAETVIDPALEARLRSYELAFRMQTAVPNIVNFSTETADTHKLYGLDQPTTKAFGQQLLAARKLVESGVRFVQVYHGSSGGAGSWDAHGNIKTGHTRVCGQTDLPIAGLLRDLKRRGLLDETLVVWGTEFGRTPGAQGTGRDHHPYGFSVWLAGGGIKGGVVHGKTDELGFHAVEDRHYITDLHATVMYQLGLNPRRLEIPGRKRLEIDYGQPIHDIIA